MNERGVQSAFEAAKKEIPLSLKLKLDSIPTHPEQQAKLYWPIHGLGILGCLLALVLNWNYLLSLFIFFLTSLGTGFSKLGDPALGMFLLPIPTLILGVVGLILYKKFSD